LFGFHTCFSSARTACVAPKREPFAGIRSLVVIRAPHRLRIEEYAPIADHLQELAVLELLGCGHLFKGI